MEKKKVESRLVSAAELVVALPEFFTERNQVLRLAKSRVIPCYVLPVTLESKRVENWMLNAAEAYLKFLRECSDHSDAFSSANSANS